MWKGNKSQSTSYHQCLIIMKNASCIKELKSLLKELKKEKQTPAILRCIYRIKALIAYYKGNAIDIVASCYDISTKTLKRWIKKFETLGCEYLRDKARPGRPSKLSAEQLEALKEIVSDTNQRVWVARHIYVLIFALFNVVFSVSYLPQLLRNIGLSFHKTTHYLVKRNNEKRRAWIQEKLPEIYKDRIKEGWRIFYQDEVGFQTEGTLAYTWGPKGKKVEIKNFGRHGRVNLIGAFELGTGKFYGVLTSFKVNAMRFRRFICHLKREMRTDKILLICDNARFHKAKWLTEWVEMQKEWLRLEFLPAYSPDFNPIERLWRWIKVEFTHNHCWGKKMDLKKYLEKCLAQMKSCSDSLRSLMKKENTRLKNICEFYEMEVVKPFNI
jgi:transposase